MSVPLGTVRPMTTKKKADADADKAAPVDAPAQGDQQQGVAQVPGQLGFDIEPPTPATERVPQQTQEDPTDR